MNLIALSFLSKTLKEDYATMKRLAKNPSLLSELVPYLSITTTGNNPVPLYDTKRYLHQKSFNADKEVLVDLVSAEIEVGKNGYPSLIEGTVVFKILNANKIIDIDNRIQKSDLFHLMSYKRLKFGWSNRAGNPINNLNLFDEEVMEASFSHTYNNNNVATVEMKVGSSLQYFNKIEHALITGLKETYGLGGEHVTKQAQNNAKQPYDAQFQDKQLSNILNFDTPAGQLFLLYNRFYFHQGHFVDISATKKALPLKNFPKYSSHFFTDCDYGTSEDELSDYAKQVPMKFFPFTYQPINAWYGNDISFMPNKKNLYTAIVPRVGYLSAEMGAKLSRYLSAIGIPDWFKNYENAYNRMYDNFLIDTAPEYGVSSKYNPNDMQLQAEDKLISYNSIQKYYIQEYMKSHRTDIGPAFNPEIQSFIRNCLDVHTKFMIFLRQQVDYIIEHVTWDDFSKAKTDSLAFRNKILDVVKKIRYMIYDLKKNKISETMVLKSIMPTGIKVKFADQKNPNPLTDHIESTWTEDISYFDFVLLSELNSLMKYYNSYYDNYNISSNAIIKNYITAFQESKKDSNVNYIGCIVELLYYIKFLLYDRFLKHTAVRDRQTWFDWDEIHDFFANTESFQFLNMPQNEPKTQDPELKPISDEDTERKNILTQYKNRNNLLTLEQIVKDINKKLDKSLSPEYAMQVGIYDTEPSLPDASKFSYSFGKNVSILKVENGSKPRLKNLYVPKSVWFNIVQSSDTLFDMLSKLFEHFRHFNLNLSFNMYRLKSDTENGMYKPGTTVIELFCINILTDKLEVWDGNMSNLEEKFPEIVVIDYNERNSIVTGLNASAKTQNTLFITLMPSQNANTLVSILHNIVKYKDSMDNEAKMSAVRIYQRIFEGDNHVTKDDASVNKDFQMVVKSIQQYDKKNELSDVISTNPNLNDLGKDVDLNSDIATFFSKTGTIPAHLLFGGYSITIDMIGINGFGSFMLIALRNTGLYDGIYMVENVKQSITKESFTTSLTCKLLVPKIRPFALENK